MDRHHHTEHEKLRLSPMHDATPERHAAAKKSTWVSVFVNLVLATAQIIVGFFSHSQSLVSDGFHSLSDLVADFVVLAANRISSHGADATHPYGHARFETVASMVLGMLLIAAGGVMLAMAAQKFLNPALMQGVHAVALYTALLTIVSKELLFRYMLRVARRVNSTMLVANAWHARADAVSSLVVAVGIAGNLMGYHFLDPLAAAVVGLMICRTGGMFAFKALSQLMDSGVSPDETEKIRQTLLDTPGVVGAHDLRTRYMGDDVIVDVHLIVGEHLSASEAHQIGNDAARRVCVEHHVLDVLVHIDTEDDADESDNAMQVFPNRFEIEALMPEIMSAVKPELTLHYLADHIDMDMIFHAPPNDEQRQQVNAAIARMKDTLPMLRDVRLLVVTE
jgi:cation diffusion facilitator family transporter